MRRFSNSAPPADVHDVVVEYLDPALAGLKQAAAHRDGDAARAYALEIAFVAATLAAACAPDDALSGLRIAPTRRSPGPTTPIRSAAG